MTPRAAATALLLVQISSALIFFVAAGASLPNSTDAVGPLDDSADEYNKIESGEEEVADRAPDDDDGPRTPAEDSGPLDDDDDVGEKLLLTPLLEAGHLDEARQLSRVKGAPFPDHVDSYSGFFTIDPQFDSNLFFWFFPAERNWQEAPVIVWLQGGPGQPSLIGIFMEIGPFSVAPDKATLQDNPHSWHKNYSLLFIDNPVGTGFSYTNNQSGYATNQAEIADGLYKAVLQFFTLFPELQENPLYVAGESYGGKHAISLAHFIHNGNPSANTTINLKGLFIVSGFFDPVSCLHYSELLYQVGLLDFNERKAVKIMEQRGRELIRQGKYEEALYQMSRVRSTYREVSGMPQLDNFMVQYTPSWNTSANYAHFVQRSDVRRSIHVGDHAVVIDFPANVYYALMPDQILSVKPWLEDLLDAGYRVVCFSGQLDVNVAYSLSVNMYLSLKFSASEEYRGAKRQHWYVDNELAGYTKTAGNFTEVLVRSAGHMVPMDQPRRTLVFVNTVISQANKM